MLQKSKNKKVNTCRTPHEREGESECVKVDRDRSYCIDADLRGIDMKMYTATKYALIVRDGKVIARFVC